MSEKPHTAKIDVFNALDEQEIRQLVDVTGIYCRGAVENYTVDNQSGKTGFVQVLVKARPDSAALKLERIKVREDCYGLIDLLNKSKALSAVVLNCELVTYGQRSNLFLIAEQKSLKVA